MTDAQTITVVIAEDEPVAREKLARWVEAESDLELVGQAADGASAVTLLAADPTPDLLFLDVRMPGLNGLEVLAHSSPRYVVFTTAYEEFAVAAFEADAVDYLLKPFGPTRFQETLARVRRRWQEGRSAARRAGLRTLYAMSQGRVRRIPLADVFRFEARGDYVAAWTKDGKDLVSTRLSTLAEQLETDGWVLVHRSHLVRLAAVTELTKLGSGRYRIRFDDGAEIDTSRSGGRRLREAMAGSSLGERR